ncbi:MAG: penicillin acylase family protein [Candidatus Kariarchaeaceae archaeon]|jgi:penicillin amidase
MASVRSKILAIIVIVLLSAVLGIYTGIKNSSDYQITEISFDEISADVKVYRDEWGVPTIIAENEFDLFFAQGYEVARDRLWQLEFFRSVSNGELTELLGDGLVNSDKYLKTLAMKETAIATTERLDQSYLDLLEAFVLGINKYIELHSNNLPLEFALLGAQPKNWEVSDVVAMQGVLSRTLSFGALSDELFRNRMLERFGAADSLELYPLQSQEAEDYFLSLSQSDAAPIDTMNAEIAHLMMFSKTDALDGSNNWVVGPERSETGNPIMANDPHLSLQTGSIWWQVHLYSPTFHVEGYSIPGTPGVILGHNDHVTWGVTNTGLDAVDIFYFKKSDDGSQYWLDNEWKDFTSIDHEFNFSNGTSVAYSIPQTEYGPVLDPEIFDIPEESEYAWVMRWTYQEGYDRDLIIKSVFDYNRATNMDEFLAALEYFAVPGQNFVFATTEGDYGYQFTGIIPIRTTPGSGIIPQNGSDPAFGWSGIIDYADQYRVVNEETGGFFHTANEQIDIRDDFYITDLYTAPFRGDRIVQLLQADDSITNVDMQNIQGDTFDLYSDAINSATMDAIMTTVASNPDLEKRMADAKEAIEEWDGNMTRDSTGATVSAIYRLFLEEQAFKDDFGGNLPYGAYDSNANWGMVTILDDPDNRWWDDTTTTEVENRDDIVHRAFDKTVAYLVENVSRRPAGWAYGSVHKVVFEHPMGGVIGLLNEGNTPSDGSKFTVKAAGGTPDYDNGAISFTQTHGSSMRYVAEAEPSWSNVWGIVVPGTSEHFFHGQRGNSVDDWVNNILHEWNFGTSYDIPPTFTYRKV